MSSFMAAFTANGGDVVWVCDPERTAEDVREGRLDVQVPLRSALETTRNTAKPPQKHVLLRFIQLLLHSAIRRNQPPLRAALMRESAAQKAVSPATSFSASFLRHKASLPTSLSPRFVTFIVVFVINFLARARLSRPPLPPLLLARSPARMPNISRGTYVDVACLTSSPSTSSQ